MLAFIDCFEQTPVNHCVNNFLEATQLVGSYHMSQFGLDSLDQLKGIRAYIILGSAANVADNPPWQSELIDKITKAMAHDIPILGICYGHQLMAHLFQSELGFMAADRRQFKQMRKVKFLKESLNYRANEVLELGFAHQQVITKLGPELEVLAESEQHAFEVIRHKTKPFIGTQAHPEASLKFLHDDCLLKNSVQVDQIQRQGRKFILNCLKELKAI